MKTIKIFALSLLAVLAISFYPGSAQAKGCPDGFSKGNKKTCYKIHGVQVGYGITKVLGELVSLRNRRSIIFSVSLYNGKKLLCKAHGVVNEVDKNDEIAFEALCDVEVSGVTRKKFRVNTVF